MVPRNKMFSRIGSLGNTPIYHPTHPGIVGILSIGYVVTQLGQTCVISSARLPPPRYPFSRINGTR